MKKIIALLAVIILIAACKKSSVPTPVPPVKVKEYFRGKLNGVVFNDTTLGKIINDTQNSGIQISGFHTNGQIQLWLKQYTDATGERILNLDNSIFIGNSGGIFFTGLNSYMHMQGGGKVNILETTSSFIRGTFEGIVPADSSYAILPTQFISEGEFKLKKP